jgi:hypothetical protein
MCDVDSRAEALADYRRVKSDAWSGDEPSLPRHMFFNERGSRNFDLPEPWPPPPLWITFISVQLVPLIMSLTQLKEIDING